MQEKLFEILFDKDELTWQNMIYEAVRSEEMDPWDVDISLLSQRFLDMLKKFKEMDFRISGKILLAAALLLKIKSNKLMDEDLTELDRLFSSTEDIEGDFYEELEAELDAQGGAINLDKEKDYKLVPRTPQPRKRKVSVYDLVAALNKALEVKRRRATRAIPELAIEVPTDHVDITVVIKGLYSTIKDYFAKKGSSLTFSHLTPSDSKEDKVATFVPLLHLTNQRKIDLMQEQHFGEIGIILKEKQ
ncbi:segregation/condensation protein A [Candidatus Woesearchaeota archaeon]|nr:segregation/condensation protein A [Candidatus Woesearchaeota archaeon]